MHSRREGGIIETHKEMRQKRGRERREILKTERRQRQGRVGGCVRKRGRTVRGKAGEEEGGCVKGKEIRVRMCEREGGKERGRGCVRGRTVSGREGKRGGRICEREGGKEGGRIVRGRTVRGREGKREGGCVRGREGKRE